MSDIRDFDVDLNIHDRYVAFSAEVVRLSLLAPVVLAFFATYLQKTTDHGQDAFKQASSSFEWCFIFMALAVGCGLAHRFFAIEFLQWVVEKKRGIEPSKAHGHFLSGASTLSIIATPSLLAVAAWFLLQAVRNVFNAL